MASTTPQPGELREDDDYTTALYRAAIGPVHTDYYLAIFAQWESGSRLRPHWNWAAGLCTFGWLLFRQMGVLALAYVGALVACLLSVFGIGRLIFDWSTDLQLGLLALLVVAAVAVPGLWGNVWFHSHCRKRVAQVLPLHADVAPACAALARGASQRRRAFVVALGHLVALGLVVLVAGQFAAITPSTPVSAAPPAAPAPTASPQMVSGRVDHSAPNALPSTEPMAVAPPVVTASAPAVTTAPIPEKTPLPPPIPLPASPPAPVVPAPIAAVVPVQAAPAAAKPKAEAPPPARAPKPAPTTGGFGVNVGLFAKAPNAEKARALLAEARLPVEVQTLDMPNGPRIRVRVGPFETRAQAQAAAVKVRALGLDAVTYPP